MRYLLFILLMWQGCRIFSSTGSIATAADAREISVRHKPNPVWFGLLKKHSQRKKVIASALAFPLPFGLLGIHRIYLGTKPYIPVVYVGTLGGCAGILPLIDFVTLVSNRDISRFQSNPRIFMWVDNEAKK
jgi:TM2 domain-containing membrane protein YozV